MAQVQGINSSLMSILIGQLADGAVKQSSLATSIKPNVPVYVGDNWRVQFKKVKPGEFLVQTFEGDKEEPLTQIRAGDATEARLAVLELAVDKHKELNESASTAATNGTNPKQ